MWRGTARRRTVGPWPLAASRFGLRFLVDLDDLTSGHPFKGINSAQPHAGAHINFDNSGNRWPKGGKEPANYPAIYAVADGVISRVDFRFGQRGGNDRYGLDLTFAVDPKGNPSVSGHASNVVKEAKLACGQKFNEKQSFEEHDQGKRVKCPKCGSQKVKPVIGSVIAKTSSPMFFTRMVVSSLPSVASMMAKRGSPAMTFSW